MPTFIVVGGKESSVLEARVKEQYPEDHYVLRRHSQWLVEAEKTTKEVADGLDLNEETGPAVVFLTSGYWGFYGNDLWEWLKLD